MGGSVPVALLLTAWMILNALLVEVTVKGILENDQLKLKLQLKSLFMKTNFILTRKPDALQKSTMISLLQ